MSELQNMNRIGSDLAVIYIYIYIYITRKFEKLHCCSFRSCYFDTMTGISAFYYSCNYF